MRGPRVREFAAAAVGIGWNEHFGRIMPTGPLVDGQNAVSTPGCSGSTSGAPTRVPRGSARKRAGLPVARATAGPRPAKALMNTLVSEKHWPPAVQFRKRGPLAAGYIALDDATHRLRINLVEQFAGASPAHPNFGQARDPTRPR